ncbi:MULTISPECIES: hypothetical protein [unclassified Dokdonia]|jgi:hypothetical protein|uniref:Uncharacterized protein n=2 Tax=Dokdonia TaxID=326319 RepID=H6RGQ9_9FLAO|nr:MULTISPECIES: hypothetical protein [unclassified Dokdonia]AEE18999.1 hypothetical protein Krodi_1015 [Dokdonia sp. 4H-3-7-5]AOE06479.1 hypothetical protein [uncultured bacterium]MDE0597723.1 hypothetical protein [Dokdonia donghaensis]CCG00220.1 conserved hypothetical protein [uncultured Dokdonia sp.]
MKTLQTETATMTDQKINLIDGVFTATEAGDILHAMLDKKINFHKLQRLSRTEGNIDDACEYDSGRIIELLDEKGKLKSFLSDVRADGGKLEIKSTVEIRIKK